MNLKQTIRKILKEETEGINSFLERVVETYPQTEEFIDLIRNFIENSKCKKIEVARFKHAAFGLALHNGVLFNENIFTFPLPNFLYIVFHELAHQYQYKKYGDEKMYEFYLGQLPLKDAAIAMKKIELVADEFAIRKIRELVKLGYLSKDDKTSFQNFYQNVSLDHFEFLIHQSKNNIRKKGITDFDGVSNLFYNMVKADT